MRPRIDPTIPARPTPVAYAHFTLLRVDIYPTWYECVGVTTSDDGTKSYARFSAPVDNRPLTTLLRYYPKGTRVQTTEDKREMGTYLLKATAVGTDPHHHTDAFSPRTVLRDVYLRRV